MRAQEYQQLAKLDQQFWWFKAKCFAIDSILSLYTASIQAILDIGCGTGGISLHLKKYGRVICIEQNSYAVSVAQQRGLTILQATANALPFTTSKFSLITFFDVLYHQKIELATALQEAHRVLDSHGLLLITDSADPKLWSHHDEVMHARTRFTKQSLESAVTTAGFTVIRCSYFHCLLYPVVYLHRKVISTPKHSASIVQELPPLLEKFFLLISKLESWLLQYFDLPFGSSLILLARKR